MKRLGVRLETSHTALASYDLAEECALLTSAKQAAVTGRHWTIFVFLMTTLRLSKPLLESLMLNYSRASCQFVRLKLETNESPMMMVCGAGGRTQEREKQTELETNESPMMMVSGADGRTQERETNRVRDQ